MSTNKHALIRYKILDNCFRNIGRQYYISDLISECEKKLQEIDPSAAGISRRQILYDIAFMESEDGWSIDLLRLKDGKKVYYRYCDPDFSINNMPLNEVEINQLRSAMDILSQFRGMPQFEWVNETLQKLRLGVPKQEQAPVILDFDNNEYLRGIEHLGDLYNAIFYKKVLSIKYQPFDNEVPYDITIHPYFLKQHNNRWFLFGYNPENGKYNWNLAIDRIQSFSVLNTPYQDNNSIDWKEYFEDIIGVTKPDDVEIENVVLNFTGRTCKYILSKPIHGSQTQKWLDSNTLQVRLKVFINYELERLILSYAEQVTVVKPQSLALRIQERLTLAGNQYKELD